MVVSNNTYLLVECTYYQMYCSRHIIHTAYICCITYKKHLHYEKTNRFPRACHVFGFL